MLSIAERDLSAWKFLLEIIEGLLSLDSSNVRLCLQKILEGDALWSSWKNEGCPNYVGELKAEKLVSYKRFAWKEFSIKRICCFRKEITPYNPNIIDLGNPELTRLWNINPNNLDSCKANNRHFDQKVELILGDVLDEIDPEQMVEEEYM
jgi:THO complex subunit 1